MPLNAEQKEHIKNILRSKLREKIAAFAEQEDMNKPLYYSLFSKEIVFTASLLQSIYTWLGGKWEEIAETMAHFSVTRFVNRYKQKERI